MALEINEIAIQMQVGEQSGRRESPQSPSRAAASACGEPLSGEAKEIEERSVRRFLQILKAKQER